MTGPTRSSGADLGAGTRKHENLIINPLTARRIRPTDWDEQYFHTVDFEPLKGQGSRICAQLRQNKCYAPVTSTSLCVPLAQLSLSCPSSDSICLRSAACKVETRREAYGLSGPGLEVEFRVVHDMWLRLCPTCFGYRKRVCCRWIRSRYERAVWATVTLTTLHVVACLRAK